MSIRKLKDGKDYGYLVHGNVAAFSSSDILQMQTLAQLHAMFHVENLPETIPEFVFLRNTFSGGQWITELSGNFISFPIGGENASALAPGYDYNFLPTHITAVNPWLNSDGTIPEYSNGSKPSGYSKISPLSDGVLIKPNSTFLKLNDIATMFADLESTSLQTVKTSLYNSRMSINWLAKSDEDAAAVAEYLDAVQRGDLAVIFTKEWQDHVELALGANAGSATLLNSQIEALQYIRAYKYQTIGVQSNHSMKREAINESEAGMNENSLLPLIDDIFNNLRNGLDECNRRWNWGATITYASAWEETQERTEATAEGGEQNADPLPAETERNEPDKSDPEAGVSVG